MDEKTPLNEVIAKINEKFKGNFTEGDKVILSSLREKLLSDKKLKKMAQSSDPQIFVESIFPKAFGTAAQDGYMEAQESYQSLFEDTAKYNAIMSALAEVVYREMRKKDIKALDESGAYTYEIPQNLSMVAETQAQALEDLTILSNGTQMYLYYLLHTVLEFPLP